MASAGVRSGSAGADWVGEAEGRVMWEPLAEATWGLRWELREAGEGRAVRARGSQSRAAGTGLRARGE